VDAKTAEPSSPFDDGELYDVILKDFTYGIDFYVDLAKRANGPVLDIACGTGRVLLPCLQAGADVDGLDFSEGMLSTLRKKAAALKLAPHVYRSDMSDFHLPRRYALIMITFNAFCHNLTQETQIRCLEHCRQHLLASGLLAFDAFFPSLAMISTPDNTRVLEGETKDPRSGSLLRCYDTRSFDRVKQIQHSIYEIESVGTDGSTSIVHRSEFDTRWTYKDEMALLLRVAGFSRWEIVADFDRRPLAKETDGMVVFAWADTP
jgi:SAM-dependent methyltransferase